MSRRIRLDWILIPGLGLIDLRPWYVRVWQAIHSWYRR